MFPETNETKRIVKKVPKGTSDYQSAWILEEDEDEDEDDHDDEQQSEDEMMEDELMEEIKEASDEDCSVGNHYEKQHLREYGSVDN